MRQTANQTIVLYFLMAAIAAVTLVGEEPLEQSKETPDGSPSAISEWGLSGVVWSEANLVRKLAVETAKADSTLTTAQMKELRQVAVDAEALVKSMEKFGWRRLHRETRPQSPEIDVSPATGAIPEPEIVGAQLAESLGLEPDVPEQPVVDPPREDRVVSRYDTETPVGRDDPGVDDEITPNRLRIDIDQYRVDDYIDETPTEARNLADAREDGVEGAIAAANPDAIDGPGAGHISYRESQTRSATLPYSIDSIYDADDYDPDVDYDVENPLTWRKMNREAADMLDGDDDVSVRKPAIAAEGEDELLAAMERGGTADPSTVRATTDFEIGRAPDNHYADPQYNVTQGTRTDDADWVQLHLELNEARWLVARDRGLNILTVRAAANQLKATMASVRRASDSKRLQALLGVN